MPGYLDLMISVIIRVSHSDSEDTAKLLAETIAPLVAGVVQGLVGRLVIVDAVHLTDIAAIAEEAGALLVKADSWKNGLNKAVQSLSSDWALIIDCGVIVEPSFWPCTEQHIRVSKAIGVSQPEWSLLGFWRKTASIIALNQTVLIRRENIKNEIFGRRVTKRPVVLPTHTTRLKL